MDALIGNWYISGKISGRVNCIKETDITARCFVSTFKDDKHSNFQVSFTDGKLNYGSSPDVAKPSVTNDTNGRRVITWPIGNIWTAVGKLSFA